MEQNNTVLIQRPKATDITCAWDLLADIITAEGRLRDDYRDWLSQIEKWLQDNPAEDNPDRIRALVLRRNLQDAISILSVCLDIKHLGALSYKGTGSKQMHEPEDKPFEPF